jgi:glyoxylase-like metal-dependent hydrolase (beta-lactamase superfamily II)
MKKILLGIVIVLVVVVIGVIVAFYPALRSMFKTEVVQVDPGLTLVLGGGGNSGILVGDSAVIVIDTKMMGNSKELFEVAKQKAGTKTIMVINTHYHPDHVGGNKFFKGSRIYIGNYEKEFLRKNIDAENQPTDVVKDSLLIDLGNEKVHLYDLGQAHTWHDVVVYLENRRLLFTGDLIFNHVNPVLEKESGSSVSLWIRVLDVIRNRWENSRIVSGHGAIGGRELVEAERQYFQDMTAAALESGKESQMTEAYKDWLKLPGMSSPARTIEYIRMTEGKK